MRDSISVLDKKVNIYKRGRSSKWQAAIKLKNGKWERFSTGTDDESEAREKALQLFYGAEAKAENKLPQSTRKFRNVAKYAIQRMEDELENESGKTIYKDYIRVISKYLLPFFGNYNIANINAKLLKEYEAWRDEKMGAEVYEKRYAALKNKASNPKDLAAAKKEAGKKFKAAQSTINTHNSALNRVLDEALFQGWITEAIRPTLMNKGIKSESRGAFTYEEWVDIGWKMLNWSKTGHQEKSREIREVLRCYFEFLSYTGIRAGTEAYNLRWKNIQLIKSKGADPYVAINVDGKRGKRELIAQDAISVTLSTLASINPQIKHKSIVNLLAAKIDEPVFVDRNGNHVTTEALRQSFKQFLIQHNIRYGADGKGRSLYSLRHTYATLALSNGMDIYRLAVQMGTSVAMLEKHYSKVSARLNAALHSGRKLDYNDGESSLIRTLGQPLTKV